MLLAACRIASDKVGRVSDGEPIDLETTLERRSIG